ncbi:MAG TPA: DUF4229 domain-containing protein [Actinomycetes bacterium]|nr:DUF4229 domain-containing protein [Actinomycetes bacterium]
MPDAVGMSNRHPMLVYTGLRLLLFLVPFGILMAVQVPFIWSLLVAALASSFVSIFVLSRFRDQVSVALSQRSSRVKERMAERQQSEDAWDEAHRTDGSGDLDDR